MKRKKKALSKLAACMDVFPQVLLNVRVKHKKDLHQVPKILRLQQDIEKSLGDKGRLLLRYSGTEPLLRIMLEGEDLGQIEKFAQDLKDETEKALGRA